MPSNETYVWVIVQDGGGGDGAYTVPCVCSTLEIAREQRMPGEEIERYRLDAGRDVDSVPETPRAALPGDR